MIGYAKLRSKADFTEWLKETGWSRRSGYMSSVYNGGWYHDNWSSYFYHH